MSPYDKAACDRADRAIAYAVEVALSARGQQAVVGRAPAGAGKSHAIATAVLAARKAGLRVAVATPTNEQAFALVRDIADRLGPRDKVAFVHANDVRLAPVYQRPKVVEVVGKAASAHPLIVGTLSKLGDAHARGYLRSVDLLLVDEAFQANAVQYYSVAGLADRHLLMGDSGQLAPFTTAPDGNRWRGLDEDPLLTAVEVLRRNHAGTLEVPLPITRRLDPRALPIARAFYPGHTFDAAVLPGVRRLSLSAARSAAARSSIDAALEVASSSGWAHLELPSTAVLSADPESMNLIVALLQRLFARKPSIACEMNAATRPLKQSQVAVAVSHNDQKDQLRVALQAAGLGEVAVNTANKLQGLTYELVVAWHPLAGLQEIDAFHLDPGRLCVMLTRHRQACIVVGRAGDRELVQGIPPATPAFVGWDSNPALDGWYVHEAVFSALERYRLAA